MRMRDYISLYKVNKGDASLKKTRIFNHYFNLLKLLVMFNLLDSLSHSQLFWALIASVSLIIASLGYFLVWLDKVMQTDPSKRHEALLIFWLFAQVILFAIELECLIYCINHA